MRDRYRKAQRAAILSIFCGLLSCTTTPALEDSSNTSTELKVFSSELMFAGNDKPNCKALLDSYCNYLYSPDTMGNIEIRRPGSSTQVLQGETKNQFSQVFYRYSSAKIRNEKYLPKDFARVLGRHNYMGKLEAFLKRKPIGSMDVRDRLSTEQLDHELGFIWTSAINETLIMRMNHEFPDFYRMSEKLIPAEVDIERRRMRRHLISEISLAVWRGDRNWEKVEQGFNTLRASYLRLIDRLDVDESLRQDWRKRITEVRLVLPGSFPEISDGECSATKINAFYYTNLNVLTVCAGDFNSEDIMQTLSHEMAHALGIDRSQYLFETKSSFGAGLTRLRGQVCRGDSAVDVRRPAEVSRLNCQEWANYKVSFEEQLKSLEGFKPELPNFQQCLKRRVSSNTLSQFDIERIAKTIIADRISDLATSERFLRLTKSQIPMINGKAQSNPNFMNPCAYYLWSKGEEPIDDELTTMLYFTAEYRCSKQPNGLRLKSSIETAKQMSERVLQSVIKIEGEFSGRDLLESQGFASPPFERFADVVGSYALAEYFATIKNPLDRKNKFLAGNSWLCNAPSLGSRYPEESSIETEYIFDSHTEGEQRKKEIISSPIREAIGCEKDFDFNECTLPMKQDSALKAWN